MQRARIATGLLVGAFQIACAFAHAIVGWSFVREALDGAGTPPDLVAGLNVAWRLGGFSMVGFGAIVLASFGVRARGRPVDPVPVALIAATWTAYGAWSFVEAGLDPFFAVMFLLPGALLAVTAPALR